MATILFVLDCVFIVRKQLTARLWLAAGLLLSGPAASAQSRAGILVATAPAPVVDTASHDESHRLEIAYTTLGEISGAARDVFDARAVAAELPDLAENLHAIRHSVEETGEVADLKQLQMCQLMLANIQNQLIEWRTALGGAHEQPESMQARLGALARPPARVPKPDAAALALA